MSKPNESYYFCVTFPEKPYAVLLTDYDENPAEYLSLDNPEFSEEIWRQFYLNQENFDTVLEQHPEAEAKLVHRIGTQEEVLKSLPMKEVQNSLKEQDISPGEQVVIHHLSFPKRKPPKTEVIGTWTVPESVNFHQPLNQIKDYFYQKGNRGILEIGKADKFVGVPEHSKNNAAAFTISGRGIRHYLLSQFTPAYLIYAQDPDGNVRPMAESPEELIDSGRNELIEFAKRCPEDTEFRIRKETYPVSIFNGNVAGEECQMSPAVLRSVKHEVQKKDQELVMNQSRFLHYMQSFPTARERMLQKPEEERESTMILLETPGKEDQPEVIGLAGKFPETKRDFASVLPEILYRQQQKHPEQADQYTLDHLKQEGVQLVLSPLITDISGGGEYYRLSMNEAQSLLKGIDLQKEDHLQFTLTKDGEEFRLESGSYKIGDPKHKSGITADHLLKFAEDSLHFYGETADDLNPDDMITCYRRGKDSHDDCIIFTVTGAGLQDYNYRREEETCQVQAYARNSKLSHQVQTLFNQEENQFSKDDLDTQIVNAWPESWKENGTVEVAKLDYPKSVLQTGGKDGLLIPGEAMYCSPLILENTQSQYDAARRENIRSISEICKEVGVPIPGTTASQKLSSEQEKETAMDQQEEKDNERPVSGSGDEGK